MRPGQSVQKDFALGSFSSCLFFSCFASLAGLFLCALFSPFFFVLFFLFFLFFLFSFNFSTSFLGAAAMTSLWRAGFLATAVSAAVAVTATAAATSTHHQPPEEPLPQLRCELDGDKFICDTNGGLNSPNRGGPTGEEHSPSPASEQCCVSTMPLLPPGLNNCGGSRPVGLPFAGRSPVLAQRGMAATSQPLSTQAALDILKQGGNAVDAAIAANAMEGVVEPMMNGLGGDLMAIVWDPKTGKLQGINSSGRSSKSLSYDELKALLQSSRRRASDLGNEANAHEGNNVEQDKPLFLPTKGPLSVSVPGAAAGWCDLFDRFGSGNLTLAQVPAVLYDLHLLGESLQALILKQTVWPFSTLCLRRPRLFLFLCW